MDATDSDDDADLQEETDLELLVRDGEVLEVLPRRQLCFDEYDPLVLELARWKHQELKALLATIRKIHTSLQADKINRPICTRELVTQIHELEEVAEFSLRDLDMLLLPINYLTWYLFVEKGTPPGYRCQLEEMLWLWTDAVDDFRRIIDTAFCMGINPYNVAPEHRFRFAVPNLTLIGEKIEVAECYVVRIRENHRQFTNTEYARGDRHPDPDRPFEIYSWDNHSWFIECGRIYSTHDGNAQLEDILSHFCANGPADNFYRRDWGIPEPPNVTRAPYVFACNGEVLDRTLTAKQFHQKYATNVIIAELPCRSHRFCEAFEIKSSAERIGGSMVEDCPLVHGPVRPGSPPLSRPKLPRPFTTRHFEYVALESGPPIMVPRETFNGWSYQDTWDSREIRLFSRRCLISLEDYVRERHDPEFQIPKKICSRMPEDPTWSAFGWDYQVLSSKLHRERDENFFGVPPDHKFWSATQPRNLETHFVIPTATEEEGSTIS